MALKKTFYVVAPLLAFSYLAYEFAFLPVAEPITRKAKPANDLLMWIADAIGSLPLAAVLLGLGILLSVYAYRHY